MDVTIDVTNPAISEAIQKVLFEKGYLWIGTKDRVSELNDRYINVRLEQGLLIKGYNEPLNKLVSITEVLEYLVNNIKVGDYVASITKDSVKAYNATLSYDLVKEIISRMRAR